MIILLFVMLLLLALRSKRSRLVLVLGCDREAGVATLVGVAIDGAAMRMDDPLRERGQLRQA